MIFRLFQNGDPIRTRSNKDNIYTTIEGAKIGLKQYLTYANRKIRQKHLQIKADDCSIVGFDLVEKTRYFL